MNTYKLSLKIAVVIPLLLMAVLGLADADHIRTTFPIQIDQRREHLEEKSLKEATGVFDARPVHPSNLTPQQTSTNKLDMATTGQDSKDIDYDYYEKDVMSDEERQKLTAKFYYTLQQERKIMELQQKLNGNGNFSMAQREEMARKLTELTEEFATETSGKYLPSTSNGQSIKRPSCSVLALVLVANHLWWAFS